MKVRLLADLAPVSPAPMCFHRAIAGETPALQGAVGSL